MYSTEPPFYRFHLPMETQGVSAWLREHCGPNNFSTYLSGQGKMLVSVRGKENAAIFRLTFDAQLITD